MTLPLEFYQRSDTIAIARELLGKVLCTNIEGTPTHAIITETEAYLGAVDRACHAYGNKRTKRTEPLFAAGGIAYVYLCYGIHHLFNVVTNEADNPHAVLVRAVVPISGVDVMLQRRNMQRVEPRLSAGPGTLSQALGIKTELTGTPLTGTSIWIEDRSISLENTSVEVGPRIGVEYAKEDALLPYRFVLKPNRNWLTTYGHKA